MRQPDITGKVILVTGAGRGIGASTACTMAEAGAHVVAAVKPGSQSDLEQLTSTFGDHMTVAECDVLSTNDVDKVVTLIEDKYGRLDALINNAGVVTPIGHIGDLNADEWANCLAVNAGGVFRCTKAFLPLLTASKGLVVNVSSGAAYRALEGWSAYCASKAALVMLSRAIALEYGEQGLRVISLAVPPTDTEMQSLIRASGLNPVSQIPREDLLPAVVIASSIAWLCGLEPGAIKDLEIDVRDPLFGHLLNQRANA